MIAQFLLHLNPVTQLFIVTFLYSIGIINAVIMIYYSFLTIRLIQHNVKTRQDLVNAEVKANEIFGQFKKHMGIKEKEPELAVVKNINKDGVSP